jgi:hypothetical protein
MMQRWMRILWPAFLMAGVLEVLVFAVVDPADLHWWTGSPMGLPRQAVYSLSFLMFWLVTSATGVLTSLLAKPADEVNQEEID